MPNSYGSLLARAAAFAVRHPGLWLLGFLVSSSFGGGTGDLARVLESGTIDVGPLSPYLAAVALFLVFLGLVFLLFTVLAEGALIHAVSEAESGRGASLSSATAAGVRFYARLLALYLAIFLLLFVLLLLLVGMPLLFWKALGSSLVVTVLLVVALAPPYFLLALGAIYVFQWAPRVAVVHGKGPLGALAETARTLRRGAGRAFSIVVGSLLNEVIALTIFVLAAIPFTVIAFLLFAIDPFLVLLPAVPFVALSLVYLGVKGTFTSAYWTLAFLGDASDRSASWWDGSAGGI